MVSRSTDSTAALFWSDFFSSSTIIFAGSFLANVINYVFTLLMSRILGVETFGEVATLIGLLTVISVPSSAFTMLMAREVATRTGKDDEVHALFMLLRKYAWGIALMAWIVFLILIPFLSSFLHISIAPFLIFSLVILFMTPSALQSGTLQGLQEFFTISKQNVLSACAKLFISLALVYVGFSIIGVVIALVCAQCISWLYGYLMTRRRLAQSASASSIAPDVSFRALYLSLLLTTFLIALLSNTDLLLAKHFLSADQAGEYGALSTMGNIIIYGIGAFTTVLLPLAASARAKGEGDERRILLISSVIIAVCACAAWLLFTLVPGVFISLVFGAKYLSIAPLLSRYAFAEGCTALSLGLINYFVAVRNSSFLYVLGAAILAEIILMYLYHSSIASVATMLVVSALLLLGGLLANLLVLLRKQDAPQTV